MNNKGQGSIEYILLLLVVVAISSAVLTNDKFKEFFGEDSLLFTTIKNRMEYSYQYCMSGKNETTTGANYNDKHDSYYNANESETHFFTPTDKYPE